MKVRFSEDVQVAAGDLGLRGINAPGGIAVSDFSYDADSFTATWTLANPLAVDKWVFDVSDAIEDLAGNRLDGDWLHSGDLFPSGDGTPGHDFKFQVNIVRGDANRSGVVLGDDVILVRNAQFRDTTHPQYSPFLDLNGSGTILGDDVILARNAQFTTVPAGNHDLTGPSFAAALATDTGQSASDRITSNAAVSGTVNDASGVTLFTASLNGGAFVDIAGFRNVDGTFSLDAAAFALVNGGQPLPDGTHMLRIEAEDGFGNATTFNLAFTLDTVAPLVPLADLTDATDSGQLGDQRTTSVMVVLTGHTTPDAQLTLSIGGIATTADGTGAFTFTGVPLLPGANPLTIEAVDLAGNVSQYQATLSRLNETASDPILAWNAVLSDALIADTVRVGPTWASRASAMVNAAMYDAAMGILRTHALYYVDLPAPVGASAEAAAAAAAHHVLTDLYPLQSPTFDAALAASLTEIPDGPAKTDGLAYGVEVARRIVALRADDGSQDLVTYTPGTAPGDWRPTFPNFAAAVTPHWGQVTPFTLASADQFQAPAPPALGSPEYAASFQEVYELGGVDSTMRTADQTEIGLFWAYDRFGMGSPVSLYQDAAVTIAQTRGNTFEENARLFGLVGLAMADAGVASWETKYVYNFWRPITAVREADTDGNADTAADLSWLPLGAPGQTPFTPPFPAYVSGHSTFGGALFEAMRDFYGKDEVGFELTSAELPGVTRQFDSFSQAAEENGRSRIYLGVHWNFDDIYGQLMGRQVADHIADNFFAARLAPVVSAMLSDDTGGSDLDGVTSDPSITGRVYADTPVTALRIGLDLNNPGAFIDVTGHLQPDGTFALNRAAIENALCVLTEGAHTLFLQAIEGDGLASAVFALPFTLDTVMPPSIALDLDPAFDTPPAGDNQTTAMAVRLIGQTEVGAAVELVQIGAHVTADMSGMFAFDNVPLALGGNPFTVRLTDLAGNVAQLDITLTRLAIDSGPPQITGALANDTGISGSDGVTFDPTITGSVTDTDAVTGFMASLNAPEGGPYVDILDLRQEDGSFTLRAEDLDRILGTSITDGAYTLRLVATDQSGNTTDELVLNFTLDTEAPTQASFSLSIASRLDPTNPALTALSEVVITGQADPDQVVTLSPTGSATTTAGDGTFSFAGLSVTLGLNPFTTTVEDTAGNQATFSLTVTRLDPALDPVSGDVVLLAESNQWLAEQAFLIDLGQAEGNRRLSFDVSAAFDTADIDVLVGDLLQVYLVDPANPGVTLLDRGREGEALFSLSETGADFLPGLVTFNGTTVTVDLTSLGLLTQGLLIIQLINGDGDEGTAVTLSRFTNVTDEEGVASPVFLSSTNLAQPGPAVDLVGGGYNAITDGSMQVNVTNIRVDGEAGSYLADLSLRNLGTLVSRGLVVRFHNLPAGVLLLNASGFDGDGDPYLNLAPAVNSGGLDIGAFSAPIELVISNPDGVRFELEVEVLSAGANRAPVFAPLAPITLMPGAHLEVPLTATDPDGDDVYFTIKPNGPLPTMALDANGQLTLKPAPNQIGSYSVTVIANDGILQTSQTLQVDVIADPVTTTRLSGIVQNTDLEPLQGIAVSVGGVAAITGADGRFQFEFSGALTSDKMKIAGFFVDATHIYPSLTEELSLLIDHAIYPGFNNQIARPIFLPLLDLAAGTQIMPGQDTTVTSAALPGLAIEIPAGALTTPEGDPFTGIISIGLVPPDLTPAGLPEGLFPGTVITIQPGGMVFTAPAAITFPNTDGYEPGEILDLWSANPNTGQFELVGKMQVSLDGLFLNTIEGGITSTSWHYPAPPLPPPEELPDPEDLKENPDKKCLTCQATTKATSEVELHSGAVLETHNLVTYQSLGATRGFTLHYNSERADPRPIIHFGAKNAVGSEGGDRYLVARLSFTNGDLIFEVPGVARPRLGEPVSGIEGGEHFWLLPVGTSAVQAALQGDLSDLTSGVYNYTLTRGLGRLTPIFRIAGLPEIGAWMGSMTDSTGQVVHVNAIDSPFGAGWQLGGVQQFVENPDGSVLFIDGDGTNIVFEPLAEPGQYDSPVGDFSTLVKNGDGTFTRTMTDQAVYQFDNAGRLISMTDRNSNTTEHVYDPGTGRLTRIIDPVGLETLFAYNAQGKVASITDPANRITVMVYDAAGNLTRITDPDGSSRQFGYDADHHLISEIDQNGAAEQTLYGFHGRATGSIRKDGSTLSFDPVQARVLLPAAATTNPFSAPVAATSPSTTFARTADANGNVSTTIVDKAGQAITIFDGAGNWPTSHRNADNLITEFTDGRGNSTEFSYDGSGNLLTMNDDIVANANTEGSVFPLTRFSTGDAPSSIAMADLNGDTFPDLVVTNALSDDVAVLLGTGTGRFLSELRYTVGDNPGSVAVADFNADDVPDLVVVNTSSNTVSLLLGNGNGTFQTHQQFPVGNSPRAVTSADFNGDGLLDLAVANGTSSNDVSVLLGNGNGTFQIHQRFLAGNLPVSITTADFNLDGRIDIAVTNFFNNPTGNSVSVLLGNGNGTFQPQRTFTTGTRPFSLAPGDFNADGIPDLAIANSNGLSVRLGIGNGTFQNPVHYPAGNEPIYVTTGDFDGDGIMDIVVVNNFSDDLSVFRGIGNGSFQQQQRFATGDGPRAVAIGDFDKDGALDLAVSNLNTDDAMLLRGTGDGRFESFWRGAAGDGPESVVQTDFNGDGVNDLAVTNMNTDDVSVFRGLGDGTFSAQQRFSAGDGPRAVALGDFNGDGKADLALVNSFSNDVSILLGTGSGSFLPQVRFSAGSSPLSVTTGDFNGDGRTDLAVANSYGTSSTVLLGNGNGTFQPPTSINLYNVASFVAAGDFNGDGAGDLAFTRPGNLAVVLGNGNGTFAFPVFLAAGLDPRSLAIGDYDGDGALDLAVSNGSSHDVSVLLGNGNGSFENQLRFPVGNMPFSLTTGDFDGDGLADLATANLGSDDVSVLLGNGDGSFQEQQRFKSDDGARSLVSGDFNGDGVLDLAVAAFVADTVTVLLGTGQSSTHAQPRAFTYDPVFNQLTSITDELGRLTLFEIDPINGNRLSTTRVVGKLDSIGNGETDDLVTTFTYLSTGLVDLVTDPLGRVTDFDYDVFGRLTQVTFAVGTVDEASRGYEYDLAGNQTAVTDENGNRSEFIYDALNRLTQITEADPDGAGPLLSPVTFFTYDGRGNLIEATDAAGSTTESFYDSLDRMTLTRDAGGNETTFSYDPEGNLIAVTDPNGNTTAFIYDARDRRTTSTDPDGGVTVFRYDSDDNLLFLTDPNGNRTRFLYDARNRLIREEDPLGAVTLHNYDAVNNLTSKTDRNDRVTQLEYDDLNRLISETWKEAGGAIANTIDYAYDKASNLLSVFDPVSSLTFTYDSRDRVKSVDNTGTLAGSGLPGVVLDYTYDGVGNVLRVTETIVGLAGAATAYQYDALNRMTGITQQGAAGSNPGSVADKRVDLGYNALGQFSSINRYSDLTGTQLVIGTDYQYDALNRLINMSHAPGSAPGSPVAFYSFEYDAASRITALTDVDGRTDFNYDDRDQLTGASRDVADARGDEDYTHDANGNRVESHLHDDGYVTGTNNRLLSDGTYTYDYDAEGNMIRKMEIVSGEVREFEWDHRNRLIRVTDRSSVGGIITNEAQYIYDALNRRIAKTVDTDGAGAAVATTEHYVYDRMHVALEFTDADGPGAAEQPVLTLRNLFGPSIDMILAQEVILPDGMPTGDEIRWLLADHLGTIRDIVDNAGAVLNHLVYDSFGNILSQTDPLIATRYAFTGREFDVETGLHYYRARYYDAGIGRFVSEDPIGFDGQDTNLYRYVRNGPHGRIDPFGLTEAGRCEVGILNPPVWKIVDMKTKTVYKQGDPLPDDLLDRHIIIIYEGGSMFSANRPGRETEEEGLYQNF